MDQQGRRAVPGDVRRRREGSSSCPTHPPPPAPRAFARLSTRHLRPRLTTAHPATRDLRYVVAIEAIVNELTGVTGGMLYFQEYQGMSAGSLWGFMSGLALGVAGVVVLARKPVAPRRTATEQSADSKQTSSGYASGEQPFSSTSSVALLDDPQ